MCSAYAGESGVHLSWGEGGNRSPFCLRVDTSGYNYQLYLENCQHLSLRTEAIKRSYRSTTKYVWFNEGFLVAWQFRKFYDPKSIYLFAFLQAMHKYLSQPKV